MTQQEWEELSTEEQEERKEEKPFTSSASEVKDDVVIINGKARPLKNYTDEITRKVKEAIIKEMPAKEEKKEERPQSTQDWRKQISAAAEREMEETGSLIPVNTIATLINQGVSYGINEHNKTSKTSAKIIKEIVKELKSTYKDFNEYEDSFNEILDTIEPQNVSKEGLKIVYNSLRGDRLDEILAKERNKTEKKSEEDKKIIGELSSGTAGSSGGNKSKKLTAEQEKEKISMGFESDEDYLGRLTKKREVFKKRNALNVPETLSENLKL